MIHKHVGLVKAWEAKLRKTQAAAKKRASTLFATMSVAHVDDDDNRAGPSQVYHVEKVMSDGDFYMGQWNGNIPHGHGKYLWTDGCMYVGGWHMGKPMGRGKFCWPSGATYEGDFKSGHMDGRGTYTGPSGDTYRGEWVMNLKHGQGTKSYSNGDRYEGEWKRGLQEGYGRYQWMNGNLYIGQWKSGSMNGNGTLIWNNGNRYEGFWEDGYPKGNGTFEWPDGSFYVGLWSKDATEQNVNYHPSETGTSNDPEWDPQEVFSVDLQDCKICPGERLSIMPSEKVYNWPGDEGELSHKQRGGGKLKRMSGDGRVYDCSWSPDTPGYSSEGNYEGMGGLQIEDPDVKVTPTRHHLLRIKPPKRQGVTIAKGHRNYELMLNLQLGIRHSVGRPAPATSLNLKPSAFDPREKLWTRFPPEGSKHTPPHQSSEFRWKDYCPVVFRTLRKLFNVDPADYMLSICGNEALRELSSPGKSGSFFYLTNDDRYMIKTMKKAEVKVLIRMLPAYYKHVRTFENTLVTRFFGLHCVKLNGPAQKKVRFVIMGNLFCSEYAIHRRYDLKGSSHGRLTLKPESEIEATTTLKDLDLSFIFRLQKTWFEEFCRQVDRDCDFLEQERIMDYSLLVGIHFRHVSQNVDYQVAQPLPSGLRIPRENGESDGDTPGPRLSYTDMDKISLNPSSLACAKLGINMPALAERTIRSGNEQQLVGEPTGEFYDVVIFFGIIDILQDYDISKKLEHAYKSIHHDPTSISAVDPRQYSRRFRDFIFRIFVEDTCS